MPALRVYFETGRRWTFACALDWPGLCRRGKGEDGAIEALSAYAPRYSQAVGDKVDAADIQVVGTILTRSGMADFGAPGAMGPWDDEPFPAAELKRHLRLLQASWAYLDAVAAGAPAELRKGPRGGGRDRDKVLAHVREAERAYAAKVGVRVLPRTPWDTQRNMLVEGLGEGSPGGAWTARYAIRRVVWHILDHAWEIEDRSEPE